MSLGLRWGENNAEDGGFIYFDAVTIYTQNYTGQVTKHPVDAGASITDHFIKDNPTFTISAVITGVDISTGTYLIQDLEGNSPYNSNLPTSPVSVNSTDSSVLTKFIPDSIGQFLADPLPEVTMDDVRTEMLDQIRDLLINLISGTKFNEATGQFDSNIQLVRLFEFDDILLKRILNNLVLTSVRFNEDANSGYALYCDLTFEQVTFAYLKKVEIPKEVQQTLVKKASPKKSLGKCDSKVKDPSDPNNKDSEGKKDGVESAADDVDPLRNN